MRKLRKYWPRGELFVVYDKTYTTSFAYNKTQKTIPTMNTLKLRLPVKGRRLNFYYKNK